MKASFRATGSSAFQRNVFSSFSTLGTLLAGALALSGCGTAPVSPVTPALKTLTITGAVHGGQQPVTGSLLQLYAVGTTGDGSAATPLILTTLTTSDGSGSATDGNANVGNSLNTLPAGFFTITNQYVCPPQGAEVYLVATGGNPGLVAGTNNSALAMMAALGPCSNLTPTTNIFIDELTTVGSVAALYPYMTSYAATGSGTGDATALANAFSTVNEYANTSSGTVPGPTLPPSTYASSTEIDTLADVIAQCINSAGNTGSTSGCGALFGYATPNGGTAPTDTIGAVLNILQNPTRNVCPIWGLTPATGPYMPTLTACPANWNLPIAPWAVSVSGAASVYEGATSQYTATVTGTTNQSVNWLVNNVVGGNSTVGTISATGLYTAPTVTTSTPVTISAVSVLSSTTTGSTSVTIQPVTVRVSGPANVLFSQTGQYTATVTGSSTTTVTWLVNNVTGGSASEGTISASGVYTAPAVAPATPVTISAQSTAFTTSSGSINVTLSSTSLTYATGDTRTVTQPTYPGICATLTAQFSSTQRSSPPAAASDDTTRIQAALNSSACKNTGLAVELALGGSGSNAFYSEQITLNGEGLTIDSGVTLYGGASYSTQGELIDIKGTNSSLNGVGTGTAQGAVDGRGDLYIGTGSTTRLVEATPTSNLIVYNVTLEQSIYPNLYIQGGNGSTVWGVNILTPDTRANADGIDLDSITNVTVTNSVVEDGDDGVAVKTNASAASNITVTNNRFYGSHGLSIGSIPNFTVTNVLFLNNYMYGTDMVGNISGDANGLVIKIDPSCAATVQQVTYQNTCMTGVKHLITFYTNYANTCSGAAGNPVFTDIIVNGVYATNSISGAYSYFYGTSAAAPSMAALAYVSLDKNTQSSGATATQYATISLDDSSLTPSGTGVTTNTFSTPGSVPTCSF
jgi:polygalacturonase